MARHSGHLCHVTMTVWTIFSFPVPRRFHYEIWLQSVQWFQRRKCLKMLTYIHNMAWHDIRTTDYLYYKLTYEPKGSGELKRSWIYIQFSQWWAYRIGRPHACVYVNIFKHLLLRSHWADWSQISYGASLGWGNESLFKWSKIFWDKPHTIWSWLCYVI